MIHLRLSLRELTRSAFGGCVGNAVALTKQRGCRCGCRAERIAYLMTIIAPTNTGLSYANSTKLANELAIISASNARKFRRRCARAETPANCETDGRTALRLSSGRRADITVATIRLNENAAVICDVNPADPSEFQSGGPTPPTIPAGVLIPRGSRANFCPRNFGIG